MLGHERGVDALGELAETPQVALVDPFGGSEGERHAVQRDRIVAPDRFQIRERLAAAHVVLGMHLEPGGGGTLVEHGAVMREAQPHAGRCCDHVEVLPPASFWQSPFGTSTNDSGSRSRVDCPTQECAPSAQSFLPRAATP